MKTTATFQVDGRVAQVLSSAYRSVERALMEIVANAWDADAERVEITIPEYFTNDPITIRDDGAGMTSQELRGEYLRVASSRRERRGEQTAKFRRVVKGRKGIGKFAGLMIAQTMSVRTCAHGKTTAIIMHKAELLQSGQAITEITLPIEETETSKDAAGTLVTLTELLPQFNLPDPAKLRAELAKEYLRACNFTVCVNGVPVSFDDVQGTHHEAQTSISDVGAVALRIGIAEAPHPSRAAGVAFRVNGIVVGDAGFFGLEHDPEVPPALLKRVCGEINSDALGAGVTADGGGFAEGYVGHERVKAWAAPVLKQALQEAFPREFALHRGRLTQDQERRLAALPEHRRQFAQRALEALMKKFYGETPERHEAIQTVVLEAFERGDYYSVVEALSAASPADIAGLASALADFGLADMAYLGTQAQQRLHFLDQLDALIADSSTLEADLHRAIENNLWVLGTEYTLYSSNKTLKTMLGELLPSSAKAKDRPDLFLATDVNGKYLLIEFKKPSISIDRQHQAQAMGYRDTLKSKFDPIHILLLGKGLADGVTNDRADCETRSYAHIVSNARSHLEWFLRQLQESEVIQIESDNAKEALA